MYCPRCGTEIPEDARFCQRCGRALSPLPPPHGSEDPHSPVAAGPAPASTPVSMRWTPATPGGGGVTTAVPLRFPSSGARRVAIAAGRQSEMATFGRRLGAWAIDGVTLSMAALAIYVGVIVVGVLAAGAQTDAEIQREAERVGERAQPLIYAVLIAGSFLYWWLGNAVGQTLGKLILGVRVVREGGGRPGVGKGLARTVGSWLSGVPMGLGYLWAAWDPSTQTWHDKLAGTYVVRE